MEVKTFLFALGAGMVAGGVATLMLPRQSQVRKTAQKAADAIEQTATDAAQKMKNYMM